MDPGPGPDPTRGVRIRAQSILLGPNRAARCAVRSHPQKFHVAKISLLLDHLQVQEKGNQNG